MNIPAELLTDVEIEVYVRGTGFLNPERWEKETVAQAGETVNIIGFGIVGLPNEPIAIFPDKNGVLRHSYIRNFKVRP